MKPNKCPAREKKMRQEKRKNRGEEKAKSKSQLIIFASGSEGRQVYDL